MSNLTATQSFHHLCQRASDVSGSAARLPGELQQTTWFNGTGHVITGKVRSASDR